MSDELKDFNFGYKRFRTLLQIQRNWVNGDNWTVLMILCEYNPQLLNHDWAVELVQRQCGKVDKYGWTALMLIFYESTDKADFGSSGFKLLWEKEKNIKVVKLKECICQKSELKKKVLAAIPDAVSFYE